jgi:hypothetical protein
MLQIKKKNMTEKRFEGIRDVLIEKGEAERNTTSLELAKQGWLVKILELERNIGNFQGELHGI